jgi:hypothetical protein
VKLDVTVNQLLRYGFGGFLLALVSWYVDPYSTEMLIRRLGMVLTPLSALAAGATIYMFYRTLLGETIVYRAYERIHKGRLKRSNAGSHTRCRLDYLVTEFHVIPQEKWTAFRLVRDQLFDADQKAMFSNRHAETHLIYVAATVFSFSCIYVLFHHASAAVEGGLSKWIVLAVLSTLSWFGGMTEDIRVCESECAYMRLLPQTKVHHVLAEARLIRGS